MQRRKWILHTTSAKTPLHNNDPHVILLMTKNNGESGAYKCPLLTLSDRMERDGDIELILRDHLAKLIRLDRLTSEAADAIVRRSMETSAWGHLKGSAEEIVRVFLDMAEVPYAYRKAIATECVTDPMIQTHQVIARFNNLKE